MPRIGKAVMDRRATRTALRRKQFLGVIEGSCVPGEKMEDEYRFAEDRRWRFDVAIPSRRIAIEFQGFWRGGHAGAAGFQADCEKFCAAAAEGWLIFPVSYRMIESAQGLVKTAAFLVQALDSRRGQAYS